MVLVDLESVASLLTCPRCGFKLLKPNGGFRCSSTSCALRSTGAFRVVGRWPVLVDFEQSILESATFQPARGGAAPLLGRRRWSRERLPARLQRSWGAVENRVAAKNIELMRSLLPDESPLVLVIGGGTIGNGVDAIYEDGRIRVLAFDVYASAVTQFIADAHQIPMATNSVDAVLVQAVLEHVLDPVRVVSEIHRVLREGGLVYAETPFLQQVHAGPYDFIRYTSSGHRYLFRAFEEIAAGSVAGPGTQLLWSVDHITRALLRSELAGKLMKLVFFWFRYLDRLVPTSFAMDNASAYYFLGRRSGHMVTSREIIRYYRGAQQPGERG